MNGDRSIFRRINVLLLNNRWPKTWTCPLPPPDSPSALHHRIEVVLSRRDVEASLSRRDFVRQPRVAAQRLPWVRWVGNVFTPKGLRNRSTPLRNPFTVPWIGEPVTQGNRFAALRRNPALSYKSPLR
jgi:hypothetical protein